VNVPRVKNAQVAAVVTAAVAAVAAMVVVVVAAAVRLDRTALPHLPHNNVAPSMIVVVVGHTMAKARLALVEAVVAVVAKRIGMPADAVARTIGTTDLLPRAFVTNRRSNRRSMRAGPSRFALSTCSSGQTVPANYVKH